MLSRKLPRQAKWRKSHQVFSFSNHDVKLRSRPNRVLSCVTLEDGMVQTNVGDGLLEAQKQSLLNSSLWSRSREAGSPGAFPHFLTVSSLLPLPSPGRWEENPGKSTHPYVKTNSRHCCLSSGCECRGKGESDASTILFLPHFSHLHPDADSLNLPRASACTIRTLDICFVNFSYLK